MPDYKMTPQQHIAEAEALADPVAASSRYELAQAHAAIALAMLAEQSVAQDVPKP